MKLSQISQTDKDAIRLADHIISTIALAELFSDESLELTIIDLKEHLQEAIDNEEIDQQGFIKAAIWFLQSNQIIV